MANNRRSTAISEQPQTSVPAPPVFGSVVSEHPVQLDDIFKDTFLEDDIFGLDADMIIHGDALAGAGPAPLPSAGNGSGSGSKKSQGSKGGSAGDDGDSKKRKRARGGRNMTEEQKLERRERNREHAKRSRVRKKFLLESLQKSVDALQAENLRLRAAIREQIPDEAEDVLRATELRDSLLANSAAEATQILDDPDYSLVKALQTAQQNFVITDPNLPDNPIVFASAGFLTLTGYTLDQVLGRNCRFLQGPDTDPKAVAKIREAIADGHDCSVCLLNYRIDGSTFWNQFFVAALRDGRGEIANYVGVQCQVSDDYAKIVRQEDSKKDGADGGDNSDDEK
uniref:LOV domain-containing protein n=1 Tax=Phaeomonas parva TaxID=124430 RepID=A0A7S1UCA1_9STRA|mmetsp:Transcript_40833/g.127885  ORF Transcript_40833/g.127885 Transcript_40833/m.127885 type:complete len:339 (+) Transcript_40833:285-1301(+)|eukprot:CAMPEP_0118850070 /NCGR_PEP_ID=MMETSP1163-20130328/101_1 /TAXON_ID=124430 /ORGANISM="Phaeomonas parva, Strain CCMP2877" /LENGTH=338 /DNA_ID=CAMNT_0006782267 /DNA_START=255 /DNA_END=1271 /DNA_ORIENTATION=+